MKSPSTMWCGDLLYLLRPPAAAATCLCSLSKLPARIISKYLQYEYWPEEFGWKNVFGRFSVLWIKISFIFPFLTKISGGGK